LQAKDREDAKQKAKGEFRKKEERKGLVAFLQNCYNNQTILANSLVHHPKKKKKQSGQLTPTKNFQVQCKLFRTIGFIRPCFQQKWGENFRAATVNSWT